MVVPIQVRSLVPPLGHNILLIGKFSQLRRVVGLSKVCELRRFHCAELWKREL